MTSPEPLTPWKVPLPPNVSSNTTPATTHAKTSWMPLPTDHGLLPLPCSK
jgi:hypothetical protein